MGILIARRPAHTSPSRVGSRPSRAATAELKHAESATTTSLADAALATRTSNSLATTGLRALGRGLSRFAKSMAQAVASMASTVASFCTSTAETTFTVSAAVFLSAAPAPAARLSMTPLIDSARTAVANIDCLTFEDRASRFDTRSIAPISAEEAARQTLQSRQFTEWRLDSAAATDDIEALEWLGSSRTEELQNILRTKTQRLSATGEGAAHFLKIATGLAWAGHRTLFDRAVATLDVSGLRRFAAADTDVADLLRYTFHDHASLLQPPPLPASAFRTVRLAVA